MTDDITERIRLIMGEYSNSPSAFADEIGVQRPAISHIMSGRNRPSLDVVMKILKAYDQINPQWLLTGEGKMKQLDLFGGISESEDSDEQNKTDNQRIAKDRLVESPVESQPVHSPSTAHSQPSSGSIKEHKAASTTAFNQAKQPPEEPIEQSSRQDQYNTPVYSPPSSAHTAPSAPPPASMASGGIPAEVFGGGNGGKKVEKIVILFADKSFSVYHPE